jgi:hypothetical protein
LKICQKWQWFPPSFLSTGASGSSLGYKMVMCGTDHSTASDTKLLNMCSFTSKPLMSLHMCATQRKLPFKLLIIILILLY